MKLVNAETLAAAIRDSHPLVGLKNIDTPEEWYGTPRQLAAAILAALPPDPRLDALLAAARDAVKYWRVTVEGTPEQALRDALAAFEEKA